MTAISNYNRGTKYLLANNYAKALQFLKREEGDFKEKYLNIGNAYRGLGDLEKAAEYYIIANREDIPLSSGVYSEFYPTALNNLGMYYYAIGDDSTAITLYTKALELEPLYYEAIWNYGNALLRSDINSALGWKMYEYRFKRASGAVRIDTSLPRWDGLSSGDSICVLTEQGLGDKIMFGRYLKLLKEKFATVNVQCHPSLDCFYSDYNIVRSAVGSCSIPICSLAGIFGLVSERYLEGKFTPHDFGSGKHIGVVWSGSTTHANNHNRSCPSHYFSNLSDLGTLHSLNPGSGNVRNVHALNSASWADTASFLLGLDLVVSVDTSIVHLAGSLGVPCLMLQPLKETDFRWGHGDKSVWYDSVKIIKNPNSWDAVFKEVRNEIAQGN